MFKYGGIALPHSPQCEAGKTMDSFLGRRWISTFKKLPKAAPKTAKRMIIIAVKRALTPYQFSYQGRVGLIMPWLILSSKVMESLGR